MKTPKNRFTKCEVEDTLNVIGNKYTVLIIRDLLDSKKRFGELQRSLQWVSPRTLSARLIQLEGDGIIKKKIYPVVPPHTEYTLTEHGRALSVLLEQMKIWNKGYRRAIPQKR
jgi:DNA-binding HxlR family transcriptional regulator